MTLQKHAAIVWVVAMLIGAGVRLAAYAHARSLWIDEAMLALNVAGRSFPDLLRPLDYVVVAPVLYLWLQRALFLAGVAAGVPLEWVLRATSLTAGLLLMALLPLVARKLAGSSAMAPAAMLGALSPALFRFANEAKPYGTDALVSVALLAVVLWVRDSADTRRRWWLLGASGALAVLFSFPAIFVAGAVGLFAVLDPRLRVHYGKVIACGTAWAAAWLLPYVVIYRAAARHVHLQSQWIEAMLVPGPDWWGRLQFALPGCVFPAFFGNGSHTPNLSGGLAALLYLSIVAGAVVLARRSGAAVLALVFGPLLLAAVASTLGRYPFGVPRLMVFAYPLLLLAVAAAVAALVDRLPTSALRPWAAAALIALVLAPDAWRSVRTLFEGEDGRALVAQYMKKRRTDEPVWISNHGLPSWLFYTTNWREPNRERLAFYARAGGGDGPCYDNAPSRGRPVPRGEGRDLVFQHRQRRELLGLSPGRQWFWRRGLQPAAADPGWAENEAARIYEAAEPCAWMYATRLGDQTFKPITWHLRDTYRGSRQIDIRVPGGLLMRWCFAPR